MAEESNDLVDIHATALQEFETTQSVQFPEREQNLKDRRFYSIAGAQWEGRIGDYFENKVKMEFNKVHLSVIRIFDEYRNNRITVDFISKDGADRDDLAELCDGLFRSDEQDSNADEAYDNGFEEGSAGGIGAWRLRADYEDHEDDENEYQRIMFEPIYDADSNVYFDLGAKRQDKSDARRCFVLTFVPTDEYEEEWDDSPASWPKSVSEEEFDWANAEGVYVAEYYKVVEEKDKVHVYEGLGGEEVRHKPIDFEKDEELEARLLATGFTLVRTKNIRRKRVKKYLMSGGKILEDCGYVAGPNIPIVPFFGKRWFVDNVERSMGHVRLSRDAQVSGNVQRSRLTEISALSGVEKPIFAAEQIAQHGPMWATDNIDNNAYLLSEPLRDANGAVTHAGPLGYTKPPQIPPALAALVQINDQDLRDILGNTQGRQEAVANISGRAEEIIQTRLDMQAYIYISNMAKSKQRCGEIWLGMAKELYVEDMRKMKTIDSQSKTRQVQLNEPIVDGEGGTSYRNDLTAANLGLAVTVGPSSSSKKAATVKNLVGMMQVTTDPESMQVLSAMAMMNIEGEGIEEASSFFRNKLIKMGAIEPTKEEQEKLAEEAAAQPEDPNTVYLQKAADNEEAKASKNRADTAATIAGIEKTQAETEETRAQTLETLSGISREDQQAAIELSSTLETETAPPQVGE